jgi:hypothetical protein
MKFDFYEIIKFLKNKILSKNTFTPEEKKYTKEEKYYDEIDIDTIIKTEFVPHWSIVKELKFSSIDKLKEQLDEWNLPYQIINFSR